MPCSNGFRLLRSGGVLIYSTCSLTEAQNENVVQWLLDTQPNARVLPINPSEITHAAAKKKSRDFSRASACAVHVVDGEKKSRDSVPGLETSDPLLMDIHDSLSPPCTYGKISGTLRFSPLSSGGVGGLFICRLTKVAC